MAVRRSTAALVISSLCLLPALAASAGCGRAWGVVQTVFGSGPDLAATLDVTDVKTGWYDAGVADGKARMVPSITFRLHNKGKEAVNTVQLMVSFWRVGTDGAWDEVLTTGIGHAALDPGASTDPIIVRPKVAYTLEGARADLFTHHLFLDTTAKVFVQRSGAIVPMGQYPLERKIISRISIR